VGESSFVTLPWWLQLLGGIFEIAGIAAVAVGISRARKDYSGKPFILVRAVRAAQQCLGRLSRRRDATASAGAVSATVGMGVQTYGTVTRGPWSDDVPLDVRIDAPRICERSHQGADRR
jgi:hypothetical protein